MQIKQKHHIETDIGTDADTNKDTDNNINIDIITDIRHRALRDGVTEG